MLETQLLCTFCNENTLERTIKEIQRCYTVAFSVIYVLENVDEPGSLCCTYNIDKSVPNRGDVPPSTISLHRKKQFNTLYTINALNQLVAEQNNGVQDRNFPIHWEELQNTILVTQYGRLKTIHTKIREIVRLENTNEDQ